MGQILTIAIAIVVLLVGTFLFARLFRVHTSLDRRAAAVAGFVIVSWHRGRDRGRVSGGRPVVTTVHTA
jgi:hypothetical protein